MPQKNHQEVRFYAYMATDFRAECFIEPTKIETDDDDQQMFFSHCENDMDTLFQINLTVSFLNHPHFANALNCLIFL